MAKQFIEFGTADEIEDGAKQDGTALTLGAGKIVRVLYDDTAKSGDLIAAMDKAKAQLVRLEG